MIWTAGLALPKPGHAAGRLVLGSSGYTRLKRQRWKEQDHACGRCLRPLSSPSEGQLHHLAKRGMGGGKRDDRFTVLLCEYCHAAEEGQRKLGG